MYTDDISYKRRLFRTISGKFPEEIRNVDNVAKTLCNDFNYSLLQNKFSFKITSKGAKKIICPETLVLLRRCVFIYRVNYYILQNIKMVLTRERNRHALIRIRVWVDV